MADSKALVEARKRIAALVIEVQIKDARIAAYESARPTVPDMTSWFAGVAAACKIQNASPHVNAITFTRAWEAWLAAKAARPA